MRGARELVAATVTLAVLATAAEPAIAATSDEPRCDAGALRETAAAREDVARALTDLRRWRATAVSPHEGATAEQLRGRVDRMAVAVHRLETHVGAFVSPPGLRRVLDGDVAAWADRVGAAGGGDPTGDRVDVGLARRLLADPALETVTARVHLVAAADRTARATMRAIEALTEGCPDQPRAAGVDAALGRLGTAGGVAATTATAVALGGPPARQGPAADGVDLAARHRELHGAMTLARGALAALAAPVAHPMTR